jgi:TATA-binding protein interacting (TIP20)
LSSIDIFTKLPSIHLLILTQCLVGLKDPAQDVKILVHLILTKLTSICPDLVLTHISTIVALLNAEIAAVPKPNAVKQEIERLNELKKSAVKVANAIGGIGQGCEEVVQFMKQIV